MACTPCIRCNVCEIVKDSQEKVNNALMVLSHIQLIANQAVYNGLDNAEAIQRIALILNASSSK